MKSNFKDIKVTENNAVTPNEDCVYEMELEGNFKNLGYNADNTGLKKELFKILPDNTLTLGYMCTCCGTWMNYEIESLCSLCIDNYEQDLERIKKGQESISGMRLVDWIDYYKERENNHLHIAFTSESLVDLEMIMSNFIPGEYIKSISIDKVQPDDNNIECQYPISRQN